MTVLCTVVVFVEVIVRGGPAAASVKIPERENNIVMSVLLFIAKRAQIFEQACRWVVELAASECGVESYSRR